MTAPYKIDYKALKKLVIDEWDPIGIGNDPYAQDEYDSYIYMLLGLVFRKASEEQIFDYLWDLETQHMGLNGDEATTRRFAKRLVAFSPQSKEN